MSNLARTLVLTTFALGLSATAAFAQEATSTASTAGRQESAQATAAASRNDTAATRAGDPGCIRDTGTHIRRAGKCLPVDGSSYTGAQLRNTGQTDTARALQMLDPRISLGN